MIPHRIEQITEDVLKSLITNGVAESRTIEYKQELPGANDEQKKEFLADVSAFSNTVGGDLIYGMKAQDGIPTEFVGVESSNSEADVRRLEQILRDGISPRITWQTQVVKMENGKQAVVIRALRSWNGPHRVIYKNWDKFYARGTADKYPLDVEQLRAAFVGGAATMDKIRGFRLDRVIAVGNDQELLIEEPSSVVVLHLIPMDAFSGSADLDVLPLQEPSTDMRPMMSSGWGSRINLNGIRIESTQGKKIHSYTQFYRSGIVEAIESRLLSGLRQNKVRYFMHREFESMILDCATKCLSVVRNLGVNAPIVASISITNTKGLNIAVHNSFNVRQPISEEMLILPEVVFDSPTQSVGKTFKPVFDRIWNACGWEKTLNLDDEGKWIGRN